MSEKTPGSSDPNEHDLKVGQKFVRDSDGLQIEIEEIEDNEVGYKYDDGYGFFRLPINVFLSEKNSGKFVPADKPEEQEDESKAPEKLKASFRAGQVYMNPDGHIIDITQKIVSPSDSGITYEIVRTSPGRVSRSEVVDEEDLTAILIESDYSRSDGIELAESEKDDEVAEWFADMFFNGDLLIYKDEVYELLSDPSEKSAKQVKIQRENGEVVEVAKRRIQEDSLRAGEVSNHYADMGIIEGTVLKMKNGSAVEVQGINSDGTLEVQYPTRNKPSKIRFEDQVDFDSKVEKIVSGGTWDAHKRQDDAGESNNQNPEREQREQQERKENIVRNVVFEKQPTGKRGKEKFQYVAAGIPGKRKAIVWDNTGGVNPKEGVAYVVQIVSDSNPEDPTKGKFIARMVEEDVTSGLKRRKKIRHSRNIEKPPAIEMNEETGEVYIGDVVMKMADKRGLLTPAREKFENYTLDERTLKVVEYIATSIQLGQPCLLTGETATSKTSAIEYLASITGHEVVRLNLGGQSDTSELIGKYVPNDGQLQIQFESLVKNPELLSEQSKEILAHVQAEIGKTGMHRGLTKLESQKIAEYEGLEIPQWRWQDGKAIAAMKRGAWLIIDEINLAQQSVRERMNPALEDSPSLTVSEHEGEVLRYFSEEDKEMSASGTLESVYEIKEGFQFFGTQNSASYAGRKPMSPAEKRRWPRRLTVENPDAAQFEAGLLHMIFDEQPDIKENGKKKYQGGDPRPVRRGEEYPKYLGKSEEAFRVLRETPGMRGFLTKMAIFHEKIADMARTNQFSGSRGKEKEIFTRTGLNSFMTFLGTIVILDRDWRPPKRITFKEDPSKIILKGLEQYYLGKMTTPADRARVLTILNTDDITNLDGSAVTHVFKK